MGERTKNSLSIYSFGMLFGILISILVLMVNVIQINHKLDNLTNEAITEASSEEVSISDASTEEVSHEIPVEQGQAKLIAVDNMSNKIYSNFENINPDFLSTDDNGIPKIGKYLISDYQVAHISNFASVAPVEYNYCEFKGNKFIHYNADNEKFEDTISKNFHAYICFCFFGDKDEVYKEISKDTVEDIFNYKIKYNDFYNVSKLYDESDRLFQLSIVYYINF